MLFNTIIRVKPYQFLHKLLSIFIFLFYLYRIYIFIYKLFIYLLKKLVNLRGVFFFNTEKCLNTGVAWLSSVRFVRSEVNSANGQNPFC